MWKGVTDALLTDSQTLNDRATQLLIKCKSGALVTQLLSNNNFNNNIPSLTLTSQIIQSHVLIMDPKTALKLIQAINLKAREYLFSNSFTFDATRGRGALGAHVKRVCTCNSSPKKGTKDLIQRRDFCS